MRSPWEEMKKCWEKEKVVAGIQLIKPTETKAWWENKEVFIYTG